MLNWRFLNDRQRQRRADPSRSWECKKPQHIAFIEGLVSETPTMTVVEIALAFELAFVVTPQCTKNHIVGICYSLKQLHHEPLGMNNATNNAKRREYVLRLQEQEAFGKGILYLDETNFNVWCSRKVGWSKVEARSRQIQASSKGQMCTSSRAFRAVDWCTMRLCSGVLRLHPAVNMSSDFYVIFETTWVAIWEQRRSWVFDDPELSMVTLLRLAAYSVQGTREAVHAARQARLLATPQGETITRMLVKAANRCLPDVATHAVCTAAFNHMVGFRYRACTKDMPVGM
ncbi:TPA: LOW QUALITY PROTEIN: hypothetical protein N0F65_012939 [Lagenidium giganteum]|uniref:Transposase n=1 Tax=Lagenidium giganteum TaxID=4803 RepID=A0AAV2Z4Y4_9STRA|nr:TPA: LOW QUALITY PROTEIN: hypothetical protein N0F65_012939 [Lagenidium giganteum]